MQLGIDKTYEGKTKIPNNIRKRLDEIYGIHYKYVLKLFLDN